MNTGDQVAAERVFGFPYQADRERDTDVRYIIERTPAGVRCDVEAIGKDRQGRPASVGRRPLRHAEVHSPTGFEYGYGGSGPADLALSILADYFGEQQVGRRRFSDEGIERAWRHHQRFKWDVIARIPSDRRRYVVTAEEIRDWLSLEDER